MLETQYSLAWEQHLNNISYGLSKFQQNGEFVDMTLAADGYFVQVHQMVLSLVSPYIKEIIKSTKCTHPVIFLNKMSYKTLSSVLDYIYKGEVQVPKSGLDDLIQAGKDLQIKGLQEMNADALSSETNVVVTVPSSSQNVQNQNITVLKKEEHRITLKPPEELFYSNDAPPTAAEDEVMSDDHHFEEVECFSENTEKIQVELLTKVATDSLEAEKTKLNSTTSNNSILDSSKESSPLYTISIQGSLQLIVDNFIYNLKYNSPTVSNHSQWKCVEYVNKKCPAFAVTRNDCIMQKVATHSHPPHEERISKKILAGEIFSTYKTAEEYGLIKKKNKSMTKQSKKSIKKVPKL